VPVRLGRLNRVELVTTDEVAGLLAEAGVESILNFAPQVIRVPEHIELRAVDFSHELRVLSYHLNRRRSGARSEPA